MGDVWRGVCVGYMELLKGAIASRVLLRTDLGSLCAYFFLGQDGMYLTPLYRVDVSLYTIPRVRARRDVPESAASVKTINVHNLGPLQASYSDHTT